MKKILAASFVLAALVGCTSPTDNWCLKAQECAEEEDPAAECQKLKDDQSEEDAACADTCKAEGDALAQCVLDNGKCEDKVFGGDPELYTDTCKTQSEAYTECAEGC